MEVLRKLGINDSNYNSNETLENSWRCCNTDSFCKGPFWNSTLTWYTNDPDITECFRDTVLVGVPCAFLWAIGLPLYAWKLMRGTENQKHSKIDVSNRPRLKGKLFTDIVLNDLLFNWAEI